jgi:GNAT superfamily N-acetyltransferase
LATTVATAAKLDGGCAGLRRPFVKASMEACDCFLYYTSNGVILGFATVLVGGDDPRGNGSAGKSVEIDLLCGNKRYSGVGSKLIDAANRVAKAAGYAHIRLKSVRTARNFYGRLGFTANGVDDAEGLVRMTKAVTRRHRRKANGRGTRRRM